VRSLRPGIPAIVTKLKPGQTAHAGGHELAEFLGGVGLAFLDGFADGGGDEVLEHFGFAFLDQRGVDLDGDELAFAGRHRLDLAAGSFGAVLARGEFGLQLAGLGLKFLRLLHHFHHVHGTAPIAPAEGSF
jgi:hypothetical protein